MKFYSILERLLGGHCILEPSTVLYWSIPRVIMFYEVLYCDNKIISLECITDIPVQLWLGLWLWL